MSTYTLVCEAIETMFNHSEIEISYEFNKYKVQLPAPCSTFKKGDHLRWSEATEVKETN